VQEQLFRLEACFAGKPLQGKLVLTLILNPDGTVKEVKDSSGTLKNASLKSCVLDLVRKWQFPAAKDGRDAKVTITMAAAGS
jgi:Ca-activated chloride channel family protein